jgi:small RNA 2'-O-methyltransferase
VSDAVRASFDIRGWDDASSDLHEARLDAVMGHLTACGAASVLDLGCGSGALLERLLARPALRRIVGVDQSPFALATAERRLAGPGGVSDDRLSLREASMTSLPEDLVGFDAAVMIEAIEHLDPGHLSRLEHGLFARLRPGHLLITTPNSEYNSVYGLAPGRLRHPDHRFEWDRPRFERWARGVGTRNGYDVSFEGIGPAHAWLGASSQMAIFRTDTSTGS